MPGSCPSDTWPLLHRFKQSYSLVCCPLAQGRPRARTWTSVQQSHMEWIWTLSVVASHLFPWQDFLGSAKQVAHHVVDSCVRLRHTIATKRGMTCELSYRNLTSVMLVTLCFFLAISISSIFFKKYLLWCRDVQGQFVYNILWYNLKFNVL